MDKRKSRFLSDPSKGTMTFAALLPPRSRNGMVTTTMTGRAPREELSFKPITPGKGKDDA